MHDHPFEFVFLVAVPPPLAVQSSICYYIVVVVVLAVALHIYSITYIRAGAIARHIHFCGGGGGSASICSVRSFCDRSCACVAACQCECDCQAGAVHKRALHSFFRRNEETWMVEVGGKKTHTTATRDLHLVHVNGHMRRRTRCLPDYVCVRAA